MKGDCGNFSGHPPGKKKKEGVGDAWSAQKNESGKENAVCRVSKGGKGKKKRGEITPFTSKEEKKKPAPGALTRPSADSRKKKGSRGKGIKLDPSSKKGVPGHEPSDKNAGSSDRACHVRGVKEGTGEKRLMPKKKAGTSTYTSHSKVRVLGMLPALPHLAPEKKKEKKGGGPGSSTPPVVKKKNVRNISTHVTKGDKNRPLRTRNLPPRREKKRNEGTLTTVSLSQKKKEKKESIGGVTGGERGESAVDQGGTKEVGSVGPEKKGKRGGGECSAAPLDEKRGLLRSPSREGKKSEGGGGQVGWAKPEREKEMGEGEGYVALRRKKKGVCSMANRPQLVGPTRT